MKALTIKEPWATLIIDGYKKYEFRSWKTNYRGKILIHAGMSEEKDMLNKGNIPNFNKTELDANADEHIGQEDIDILTQYNEYRENSNKINNVQYIQNIMSYKINIYILLLI